MRGHRKGHVEDRLQAWLDGELAEADEEIRNHIDRCESCSKALQEARAVQSALRADSDRPPLRPMWPAVIGAMSREARPRFGFSFGLATSFAAAAGLVIGLALGSSDKLPQRVEQEDSQHAGSLLGDDDVLTMDQIYVSGFYENGESE
jgi:anti-sigma factor RsiW